jgi:hypothetical protein
LPEKYHPMVTDQVFNNQHPRRYMSRTENHV